MHKQTTFIIELNPQEAIDNQRNLHGARDNRRQTDKFADKILGVE